MVWAYFGKKKKNKKQKQTKKRILTFVMLHFMENLVALSGGLSSRGGGGGEVEAEGDHRAGRGGRGKAGFINSKARAEGKEQSQGLAKAPRRKVPSCA